MGKILIVDDHQHTTEAILQIVREKQLSGLTAHSGEEGYALFKSNSVDAVITDMKMPGMSGLAFLKLLRDIDPDIPVIVITAFGTVENAVEAMKYGAFDYVSKPFSVEEIELKLEKALRARLMADSDKIPETFGENWDNNRSSKFMDMIGKSPEMQTVFNTIEKVAGASSSVLILGESGTGKELIARAIHQQSPRNAEPFVKINCAALADGVLESELFGHEKGAFTGALRRKIGRFELAGKGTIFLDEIGEISPATQVKLLRVLQEKEFERVGGTETVKVEARLVAATNQDLLAMIAEKKFRHDLYYRLNVVSLKVPPLREHASDIPLLVNHFIEKCRLSNNKKIEKITSLAMKKLVSYHWPGNIRELENAIERAVVLSNDIILDSEDFPEYMIAASQGNWPVTKESSSDVSLPHRVEDYEKKLIFNALMEVKGNMSRAAKLLGINRTTLRYKMEKYDLLRYKFD